MVFSLLPELTLCGEGEGSSGLQDRVVASPWDGRWGWVLGASQEGAGGSGVGAGWGHVGQLLAAGGSKGLPKPADFSLFSYFFPPGRTKPSRT